MTVSPPDKQQAEVFIPTPYLTIEHDSERRGTEVVFEARLFIPDQCLRSDAIPPLPCFPPTLRFDWEKNINRWRKEA